MTRTWRSAPSLAVIGGPRIYRERCPSCDGPHLLDGRCAVSGRAGWCESDLSRFEDGVRWGWAPQPNGNLSAMERVREARREYREAMKEPQP